MTKAQPTVEGLDKATKWLTTLDLRFNFCIQSIDEYLNEHEFENTLYVEVDQTDNDDEDNAIEAMKLHYTYNRYCYLFTCLTTQAIYIELANPLDTD